MIQITSLGLYGGSTVTTAGLANVTPDTPASTTFAPSLLEVTSTGLYSGLSVTPNGLFFVDPGAPAPSDFEIVIGEITSVGLYGGLNVSTTGLYSQSTFTPSTGVSGTLAATEVGVDSLAADGGVLINGTLTAIEFGIDTFAASGSVVTVGIANLIESGLDGFTATGDLGPQPDVPISTGPGKTPFKRRMAVTTPAVKAEFAAQWSLLAATTGALSIPADTPYCRDVFTAKSANLNPWVGHATPQTQAKLHAVTNTLLPNCAAVGRVSRSVALPKYKLIYPSCGARLGVTRQGAAGSFSLYEPRVVRNPSDAELLALIEFL